MDKSKELKVWNTLYKVLKEGGCTSALSSCPKWIEDFIDKSTNKSSNNSEWNCKQCFGLFFDLKIKVCTHQYHMSANWKAVSVWPWPEYSLCPCSAHKRAIDPFPFELILERVQNKIRELEEG